MIRFYISLIAIVFALIFSLKSYCDGLPNC